MMVINRYSQGVCSDGAAILCDGEHITIDEVVARLNAGARSAVIAVKHCPQLHQDWAEVCVIYDAEFCRKKPSHGQ